MSKKSRGRESGKGNSGRIEFPVVAIGASAGGIEAVVQFFQQLEKRPGMAFVFIQHLKPEHESHLVEILGRRVEQRIVQAEDGAELEADNVYVIASGTNLIVGPAIAA